MHPYPHLNQVLFVQCSCFFRFTVAIAAWANLNPQIDSEMFQIYFLPNIISSNSICLLMDMDAVYKGVKYPKISKRKKGNSWWPENKNEHNQMATLPSNRCVCTKESSILPERKTKLPPPLNTKFKKHTLFTLAMLHCSSLILASHPAKMKMLMPFVSCKCNCILNHFIYQSCVHILWQT